MKNSFISILSILLIALAACIRDDASLNLNDIDFNNEHRILSIDYDQESDTALKEIIYKSDVRKKGYGVLLNVDQTVSDKELEKLIFAFQLQDINAVHSFNIKSTETPKNNVLVALEQARFIWIFSNNMYNLSGQDCQPVIQALKQATQSGGILVIDENHFRNLTECLSLH